MSGLPILCDSCNSQPFCQFEGAVMAVSLLYFCYSVLLSVCTSVFVMKVNLRDLFRIIVVFGFT